MFGRSIASLTLFLMLMAQSAFAQLLPDDPKDRPQDPAAAKLLDELGKQRSQLTLPGDLPSLNSCLPDIDRLVTQAKEIRELEIAKSGKDAPSTKRLNLLVEGFERLSDRVARISVLVEKKEHRLAAEMMQFVAAMDRAWTGKYEPNSQPLVKAGLEQLQLAEAQTAPFEAMKKQIQTEIDANNWDEVRKLISRLIEEQRTLLGPDQSAVAESLLSASELEYHQAKLDRAIELGKSAREVLEKLYGKTHWKVQELEVRLQSMEAVMKVSPEVQARVIGIESSLEGLENAMKQGSLKEKGELMPVAVAGLGTIDKQFGQDCPVFAKAVHLIASACRTFNPSESNFRYQYAEKALRAVHLDETPEYARLLNEWSMVCKTLGDDERALDMIVKAIHLNRKLFGEEHENYITCMENFGSYFFLGEAYEKALLVFEKVARLRLAVSGPGQERYLKSQEKIAATYYKMKRFPQFEHILNQLLTDRKPEPGTETELDIKLAEMAGNVAVRRGQDNAAIPHHQRALELSERLYGKYDVRTSEAMVNLANSLMRRGNEKRIGILLTDALKIEREYVDRISRAQTERQHFRTLDEYRPTLFLYLTHAVNAHNQDRQAYEQILALKGRSFRERWASNMSRHGSEIADLHAGYTRICRILSNHATLVEHLGEKAPDESQFMKLIEQKENQWRVLARTKAKSDDVIKAKLEEIEQALPQQVALVDYFYYKHFTYPPRAEPVHEERIVAAVVRAGQPVKLIPVGQVKAAEAAVVAWRKELQAGRGTADAKAPNEAAQTRLRRLLWAPIEEHLAGIETVLVCPDGLLDLLPWDALPSKTPGKYLIEDYAIHKLPVAQFVVRQKAASTDPISMLLLGDPSYEVKVVGAPANRDGMRFNALPGTAKEISTIANLYEGQKKADENFAPLKILQGSGATERVVRELSTNSRYLHLATHGFFRPEAWMTQQAGPLQAKAREKIKIFIPEVLSGIALTAANNGSIRRADAKPTEVSDDGLLTALEVTTLDLRNVDLVVLSACDTSVGLYQANESTLGLQQSFQIAGARATIASLWPVDDAATQNLMVEFYRNLWEEKRGQGDALRQAQLSMLNRYDPEKQTLEARGLKLAKPQEAKAKEQARLHPSYWACFTLSGDWR